MERPDAFKLLEELGAKPSASEERGLALLRQSDQLVFSPGISTAGFAEIRMVQGYQDRNVIATTIDRDGLQFAQDIIQQVGLTGQIETRLEDLREGNYPADTFDFIYARLVLHYLSFQDLNAVLAKFATVVKQDGKVFTIVRSEKNVDRNNQNISFDPQTRLTTEQYYGKDGKAEGSSTRYFHTPESITTHMKAAGFRIDSVEEYQERLYKDFMRKEISPVEDHVIEVVATKQ
jgi:cyclopropane fatty-acyl-phospholipid synthase-like methyltransferase